MITKKILVIGQSLPAVKQELPYDTTMLYDWLKEVGISKDKYYKEVLSAKINKADKVWVLGRVAEVYLNSINALEGKISITTIHPSFRNHSLYSKNKINILKDIVKLLKS